MVFLKLTLDILELQMKSIITKKSKCFFNGSFLSIFFGGGHGFSNLFKVSDVCLP